MPSGFDQLERAKYHKSRHPYLSLAIVGSREKDWPSELARRMVKFMIEEIVEILKPDEIISGGASGVDSWAEDVADNNGYDKMIFRPTEEEMKRDGYRRYEPRNRRIAERCDVLIRIRSNSSRTRGSEATARYSDELGKIVARFSI